MLSALTKLRVDQKSRLPGLHCASAHPIIDALEVHALVWVVGRDRQKFVGFPFHRPDGDIAMTHNAALKTLQTVFYGY